MRATEEPSSRIPKKLVDLYNNIISMMTMWPELNWKGIVGTVECSSSYFQVWVRRRWIDGSLHPRHDFSKFLFGWLAIQLNGNEMLGVPLYYPGLVVQLVQWNQFASRA